LARHAHQERTVTELQWLTASEIGAAYAARRLSPVELVRALLREIEARNPDCGAFIRVDAEGALETARRAETDIFAGRSLGPLHGIPLGAKDNIDIAGVPTTCHSKNPARQHCTQRRPGHRQSARRRRNHAGQAVAA
jgi:Asp-tRNA(Asn)/Glu-tRNA(Gln) amidotransferase A subunit family amidase